MKFSLVLGSLLMTTSVSLAQNLLGISTSRYGGTNRLYINPALAADSPSKFYLNGFTANLHANNNYVRYQAPYSLLRLLARTVPNAYRRGDGSLDFSVDYTQEIRDGKPKNGTLWGEVRGPAILFKTSDRAAFAVTTRLRAVGQLTNASQSLLSAVRAGLADGNLLGLPSNNNQFNANTNTYAELGFTYAGTIWEGEGAKLLLGATAKLLLGYNAQHLINRGLDFRIITDPNNSNGVALQVDQLNATLGYTTFLQNRSLSPRTLLSLSAPGRGVGFDLGLTYVKQYDADSPALRLGLALTDIGGLTYRGDDYQYTITSQNAMLFRGYDFNNVSGSVAIARVIQDKLTTSTTPRQSSFRAGLPTSLNLSVDYQSPGGAGISVVYLQDVRSAEATAIHQPTLVAVVPRYDARWLTLSVPISYLNQGFSAGASVRIGPAWLGTDNFVGLIGNKNNGLQPRGLDIYAGIAFGLGRVEEE